MFTITVTVGIIWYKVQFFGQIIERLTVSFDNQRSYYASVRCTYLSVVSKIEKDA